MCSGHIALREATFCLGREPQSCVYTSSSYSGIPDIIAHILNRAASQDGMSNRTPIRFHLKMLDVCYPAGPSRCKGLNKQGRSPATSPVLTLPDSKLMNHEPIGPELFLSLTRVRRPGCCRPLGYPRSNKATGHSSRSQLCLSQHSFPFPDLHPRT